MIDRMLDRLPVCWPDYAAGGLLGSLAVYAVLRRVSRSIGRR